MKLSPPLRKLSLAAHVVASVGWLGAVAAFLAVAATALVRDAQGRVDLFPAMQVMASAAIVPLAFATVTTGVISSLGTTWWLLRHYWVIMKLGIVVVATVVLLLQLRPLSEATDRAATTPAPDLGAETASLVVHSAGGVLVLLAATVLGIYKPRGITRYGARRANVQARAAVADRREGRRS
jgi:hypothetical protein